MNKLMRLDGVTEIAFNAIFRRSLIIRINARFLDPCWVDTHVGQQIEDQQKAAFSTRP